MKIRVLGAHNCESSTSKMVSLLIDDVLAIDAGSLASSLSFEAQQKLTAVLLTHSHYDHIRDVPAIGFNFFATGKTITILATRNTLDTISTTLFNGYIYPDFTKLPEASPAVQFWNIKPMEQNKIAGFVVVAVPVNHDGLAVGYQVTSTEGRKAFYAADTGLRLESCWSQVEPDLLLVEVTFPNRLMEIALRTKHLTPAALEQELTEFKRLKGYLPKVIAIHMDPRLEKEIREEIGEVSRKLGINIDLAYEGMELTV